MLMHVNVNTMSLNGIGVQLVTASLCLPRIPGLLEVLKLGHVYRDSEGHTHRGLQVVKLM